MTNIQEYLAGTYAFDPADGFRLTLTKVEAGVSTLEFLTISGRTYTIQASKDFDQWTTVNFRVVTGGVTGSLQGSYHASEVNMLRVQVPAQVGAEQRLNFRAMVQ